MESHQSAIERFLQRLLLRSALTPQEQQAILSLRGEKERVRANLDIVTPGEHVDRACLVARGLVGRFDQMLDGQPQLTSFYIGVDMCDLHAVVAPKASWSITAICSATVLRVPHRQLTALTDTFPNIA